MIKHFAWLSVNDTDYTAVSMHYGTNSSVEGYGLHSVKLRILIWLIGKLIMFCEIFLSKYDFIRMRIIIMNENIVLHKYKEAMCDILWKKIDESDWN